MNSFEPENISTSANVFINPSVSHMLLDEPIPSSFEIPVSSPTPFVTKGSTKLSTKDKVKLELKEFSDWIVSFVPEPIKRTVSDKMKALKSKISSIYFRAPKKVESAFRETLKTFRINGNSATDYKTFLQNARIPTTNLLSKQDKPIKVRLIIQCMFYKMEDGERVYADHHFSTKNEPIYESTNLTEMFCVSVERLIELIESLQGRGSGWIFFRVKHFDILTDHYKPLGGSSHISLTKFLASKKALINPKNNDNECFKWCVTEIAYPQKANRERVTKKSRENSKFFNWEGIEFPMKKEQIPLFEKNNPNYAVNVLGYEGSKGLYPISVSKHYTTDRSPINLLSISDGCKQHYVIVSNMSRLVGMQTNKHNGKSFICLNCLNTFSIKKSFKNHTEFCLNNETVRIDMPKKGETIKFKDEHGANRVPTVFYADFGSFTEKIQPNVVYNCEQSYTRKHQKHTPSGFCLHIVRGGRTYKKPIVYSGENVAMEFCKRIEMETQEIYDNHYKDTSQPRMTQSDVDLYERSSVCHICGKTVDTTNKVKDHNSLTGKFVGVAHHSCKQSSDRKPPFIPIVFHNLSGYDSHLFIKQLGVLEGDINCIADNEEKYISFTKSIQVDSYVNDKGVEKGVYLNNRFIDSLKFMQCGLDSLVKNLTDNGTNDSLLTHTKNRFQEKTNLILRKGVYPYDYMDSPGKMCETQLPPKSAFYSILNNSNISDNDYEHAQKVWREFGMSSMKDYHDLYLESDVLLLADVFESFREICLKNYKLDPAWYLSCPGLSWSAMLKNTGVELDLITEPDMLMMIEKGTRGGVSTISNRYSKVNNKYMETFDELKPSSYMAYLDANNLYGWAMFEKMPYKGFKWVNGIPLEAMLLDEDLGYILEVDLEYPYELHDSHNDYPLAPESINVNKVDKLIPNLNDKTKYVLHHRNLKLYLSLGMKLTKTHRVIEFKQSKWLAPYIAHNTNLRTKAKNNFEKDFFKLMNNSVFGKTMEKIRNRANIKLVNSEEKALKLISKPNFKRRTIFTENLTAIHLTKTNLVFNKPIYVGMCILDVSKTLMYEFHYNYIKKKLMTKLLITDTDSLCYEIKTDDFYKDISADVEAKFDPSAYPKNHPSGIKTGVNKKVVGMMKDECSGRVMTEFVGLRSKLYSSKMDNGDESKKCKGINKTVTKNDIVFENYKDVLFNQTYSMRKMNVIRSYKHNVVTEEVNKVALSGDDDKRIVLEDRIHTLAYGHYKTVRWNFGFLGNNRQALGKTSALWR